MIDGIRWSLRREWLVAPIGLAAAFWLALGQFLDGEHSVATFQDNTHLLLPFFHFLSETIARGESPYWINLVVGGLPYYSSPHFSPLYPFYFLGWGLFGSAVDGIRHLHAITFLHIFLLQVNTYVAARLLRVGPVGAFLGASIVAFSANTLAYTPWVNVEAPYAWLPLVVAGAALVVEPRRMVLGGLVATGALAMLMLAQPAQPLTHALYCMATLYVFSGMRHLGNADWVSLRRATIGVTAIGVVSLAIASPVVIPAVLGVGESIRFIGDFRPVVGWDALPFQGVLVGQLPPKALAAAFFPYATGVHGVGDPYVGPVAILLAAAALLGVKRAPVVLAFTFLGAYGLLSATGSHLGFSQVNYQLPFLSQVREPGRHLVIFVLMTGLLAGFGFDAIRLALATGRRALIRPAVLAVIAVAVLVVAASALTDLPPRGPAGRPLMIGLAIGAVLSLTLIASPRAWVRHAGGAAIVSLALFASVQYPKTIPRISDGDYFARKNLVSHKVLAELAALPDASQHRFVFEDPGFSTQFWSMNGIYHGIRSFQAYANPLPYRQFDQLFQRFNLRHYYPMLGAKYLLCVRCEQRMVADYRETTTIEGYRLFVADSAMPRYIAVSRLAGTYRNESEFFRLVNQGFDYATGAVVHERDEPRLRAWLANATTDQPVMIKEERATLNRLVLSVQSDSRAIVILNEYYSPAWQIMVNGVRTIPVALNLNQIGVPVSRGGSLVEFEYRPRVVPWLRGLQRSTLVLGVVGLVIWRRRAAALP